MPKRVIHGEALYRSDKLAQVQPPRFRPEYANLLPLALANGVFEADPRKVWSEVYSYNRPDITPEDVAQILGEFVRVKMIFPWQEPDGKVWGFFIGIDKPGRLPGKSRQGKNEAVGPKPPMDSIRKFLDSEECSTESSPGNKKLLGFGFGSGSGSGSGFGSGKNLRGEPDSSEQAPAPPATPSEGKVKGKTSKNTPSAVCERLAALLRDEILQNKPDFKITDSQLSNWSQVADRMMRLDLRSAERIADVIRFAQGDEFWMSNVLSMQTVRDKFDALELKAKATRKRNGSSAAAVGVHRPTPPSATLKVKVPLGLNHDAGAKRWSDFLANVQQRISRHSVDTWFRPARVIGIGRGVLYLRVPTAEYAEHLPIKYAAELREFLPDLKVEFRVPSEVSHA